MWRTTYIKFSLGGEQDEKNSNFAGTTEGRRLSEILADAGIAHTVCVATEYGEIVMREQTDAEAAGPKGQPLVSLHRGRMDRQQMEEFLRNEGYEIVVDATHPYAQVVTENIRDAVKNTVFHLPASGTGNFGDYGSRGSCRKYPVF